LKTRRPLKFEDRNFQIPQDSISNMSDSPMSSELNIYEVSSHYDISSQFDINSIVINEEDFVQQPGILDAAGPSDSSIADTPIHVKLAQLFERFITPENRERMEELIIDRSDALKACGIGTEELTRRLKNANAVDYTTAIFFGTLSSLGFIVGAQAVTRLAPIFKEHLSAAALPYMPGAVVGVIDRLLNSVLTETHVDFYFKGNPNLFEAVMQENLERYQRPLAEEMTHQARALTVAYTIRNVVRSVVAPMAAHFGQAHLVDTVLDGLGGLLFSGGYANLLRSEGDRRELLAHPAYLLAQANWIEQLEILQHGPLSKQRIQNLAGRIACKVPDLPQTLFNACKGLFTLNSVMEISLLMVGFACNDWLKESVAETFDDASPEASAFVTNTAGTCGLGFLYYILGASVTFTTAMTKKMQCTPDKVAAGGEVAVGVTSSVSVKNFLRAKATHIERY
jgi:hypothetical protein